MTLTVGSLFSGIGGLDLGLERAGMRVIWQSEIDPYASRVLAKHWKDVPNHGDIKKIDWSAVERPDVICGGYPCQPFSTAGKRRGEEDPRHLWPWVREAISHLRPRYAILENVRGHLSLGGTTVIGELASIGYDAEWRVVSAASVGANHRRDRVVIVAYPNRDYEPNESEYEVGLVADTNSGDAPDGGECPFVSSQSGSWRDDGGRRRSYFGKVGLGSAGENTCDVANTNNQRRESRPGQSQPQSDRRSANEAEHWGSNTVDSGVSEAENVANSESVSGNGRGFGDDQRAHGKGRTIQSAFRASGKQMADTISVRGRGIGSLEQSGETVYGGTDYLRGENGYAGWSWWETEPDVGRVAYGVSHRVDRLRGLGNAVVPQVAEVIGRLVVAHANS